MAPENNVVFEDMLKSRSMTVIYYIAEDAAKVEKDEEDRALLEQIKGLKSLDEIWIVCHYRISNWHLKRAGDIRQFLTKKGTQQ